MKKETTKNNSEAVNQYLAQLPEDQRAALEKLRQTIKKLVPEVEEFISYKMPAYRYHGMLCGFAAFKKHCSYFPWDSKTVEDFKTELKDFKTSAGTIQFTPEKPIPDTLLKKILQARVKANTNKH
ncbi:iron chaperone [Flavobacterium lacustre]|uniref:iron chaperone n=1 Tax=Flavobacterium lacustre TaxID=3016339 RepID=UPI0022B73A15|nr:DUF1801 domain-containing protein [Flavobacterium lacustre]